MNFVAAILYAVASAVLSSLALAFAHGSLTRPGAHISLGIGAAVAAFAVWSSRKNHEPLRALSGIEWAAIVAFALFSLRAFLWLIFIDRDAVKVLSPNNTGDMSLHITYIQQLAGGAHFWPDNPIYAGAKLTYPLGIDLFNSLLLLTGVDLIRGLVVVGIVGCICTGVALWRWGGAFTLAGFLFNGGVAGFAFFWRNELADFQSDLAWKSIPLALFVTQRGLLFALPAGLALLCSWRARLFRNDASAWRLPLWGEVLLYSAMPSFHVHTFLFLSFVLGFWFVAHAPSRRPLLALIGSAFIPATLLVLLVTDRFHGPSVLGWKPGWMQDSQNFFVFWLQNFGALPLLVGWLLVKLTRDARERWPAAIVFPAVVMFAICCFVKFAPWEWDNTKVMIWSYLAVLPALWSELIRGWKLPVQVVACVALFFSGFVSLLGGIGPEHRGYDIARRSQLDGVAHALRALPFEARFAAAPTHDHPLLLLGRKLAMGYEGHVWSHGYDWVRRKDEVSALMNGAENWRQIAAALGVRYVFWGAEEAATFPESTQPWKDSAALVESGEWGAIYDLGATAK